TDRAEPQRGYTRCGHVTQFVRGELALSFVSALLGLSCTPSATSGEDGLSNPVAAAPAIAALVTLAGYEAQREFATDKLRDMATAGIPALRLRAIRGLGRVGGRGASVALGSLLGDPLLDIRLAAAWAVGITGEPQPAVEPLLIAAVDDPAMRVAAFTALGRIGGEEVLSILTAGLAQEGQGADAATAAAVAMGRLGRRGVSLTAPARRALLAAAARSDWASDPELRRAVAFALVREHRPDREDGEVVAALAALVGDPLSDIRATALRALVQRGAVAALMIAALGDDDWRVRVEAVRGIAQDSATAEQRAAVASHLMQTWVELGRTGWTGPSFHVLSEGLRSMVEFTREPAVRQLADELHRSAEAVLADGPERAVHLIAGTVHCLTAALRYRAAMYERAPAAGLAEQLTRCGGSAVGGMPAPARALAAAQAMVADPATVTADHWLEHPDSRVRAAYIRAYGEAAQIDPLRAGTVALLRAGLADPSIEARGAAVAAAVALAGKDMPEARRVAGELAEDVLAAAQRGTDNIELDILFMGALGTLRPPTGESLCRRAHRHSNRSLRSAARACLQAYSGADPGPGQAERPSALPPVDPALVIGRQVILTIMTSKGELTIEMYPDDAPWHVAAIAYLVERGFYRDLLWHRVVPNFVVQGGDPLGSGWGGPNFVIPAEPSRRPFRRGSVGIADAGLDTGGSQWFIMHTRAPHLDGRYTNIGHVIRGQGVIDRLFVGDRILSARLVIR
ncbi:MAG: peptidylprolyl isomerase, partial [Myxococcota bacterium]